MGHSYDTSVRDRLLVDIFDPVGKRRKGKIKRSNFSISFFSRWPMSRVPFEKGHESNSWPILNLSQFPDDSQKKSSPGFTEGRLGVAESAG